MKNIAEIKEELINNGYVHFLHSPSRVIERNISAEEISEVGRNAILIEDLPNDKYSPSCLLLGFTIDGLPIHI